MFKKEINRKKRHYRIRKRIIGTSEVPRLSVYRSLLHLHCQLVDDIGEKTLLGLSTTSQEVKQTCPSGGSKKAAETIGGLLAEKMKTQGIEKICFDRGGYQYLGRIKTLADTLRKSGIKF